MRLFNCFDIYLNVVGHLLLAAIVCACVQVHVNAAENVAGSNVDGSVAGGAKDSGGDLAFLFAQQKALRALAPFRIEYTYVIDIFTRAGEPNEIKKQGVGIFTKDGRFLIKRDTKGEFPEKKVYAWDGKSLFMSPDPGRTYFMNQAKVTKKDQGLDAQRVPYVNLLKAFSGDSMAYDGIGAHFQAFHIFDHFALHDMYISPYFGRVGPARWCDIMNDAYLRETLPAPVTVIDSDAQKKMAVFKSEVTNNESIEKKAGKKEDKSSRTPYFMQMEFEQHGGTGYRVFSITHRGPWQVFVYKGKPVISEAEFNGFTALMGMQIDVTYDNEIAGGWFPVQLVSTQYTSKKDVDPAAISARGFDTSVCKSVSQSKWTLVSFEKMADDEVQPLFDQFIATQKHLNVVTDE